MNKELINEVQAMVAEVDKTHRYSMSKIYGLYNQAFGTSETPQSCASCLIRKVNELKKWLEAQKPATATPPAQEAKPKRGRKKQA